MVKAWLKSCLRMMNTMMGLGGIAVIVYGVLMIKVWQPEDSASNPHSDRIVVPWFFHAFLGAGIGCCAITCLGHIAANTANSFCLSWYIVTVLLLLVFETVIVANIFLESPNWEKVLPKDLTERVDEFEEFVESNDDVWKWVAWLIFVTQGVCVMLATILRTYEMDENDDSEATEPFMGQLDETPRVYPNIV